MVVVTVGETSSVRKRIVGCLGLLRSIDGACDFAPLGFFFSFGGRFWLHVEEWCVLHGNTSR